MHQTLPAVLRTAYQSAALMLLLAVAGCAVPLVDSPRESAVLEEATGITPTPARGTRYRIDPERSELRILVYPDGPLARFGHAHVISGPVTGELQVAATADSSAFRLEVPVSELRVDERAARNDEGPGFEGSISEPARRGTRENMLGPELLDAENHPVIAIESIRMTGPRWNPDVIARIRLRGHLRDARFSAAVFEQENALVIIASFRIRQSEFDIQPFSLLGGGLRVADAIDLRVRLVANRHQ